jgi:hypothetical protein
LDVRCGLSFPNCLFMVSARASTISHAYLSLALCCLPVGDGIEQAFKSFGTISQVKTVCTLISHDQLSMHIVILDSTRRKRTHVKNYDLGWPLSINSRKVTCHYKLFEITSIECSLICACPS